MALPIDDRDVDQLGDHLQGKTIEFVVTGGIAAIEAPRVVRELRRYGATVRVWMTEAAKKFVGLSALEWASKNPVQTELSGNAEHISFASGVVIYPATLDFISKLSLGLADSASLTMAQSLIGRVPVIIAPAMHESLNLNPIYQKNIKSLSSVSHVSIVEGLYHEEKRKAVDPITFAAQVCHLMSSSPLKSKAVALSLGATRSMIDDVRFVSNRSTGELGLHLAMELYRRGAFVRVIAGDHRVQLPALFEVIHAENTESMLQQMFALQSVDILIHSAAVLDFEVKSPLGGKSTSERGLSVELVATKKIIDGLRSRAQILIGFKLESKLSEAELLKRVKDWNQSKHCDLVVANRLEDVSSASHTAYLWESKSGAVIATATTKKDIALRVSAYLEAQNFK